MIAKEIMDSSTVSTVTELAQVRAIEVLVSSTDAQKLTYIEKGLDSDSFIVQERALYAIAKLAFDGDSNAEYVLEDVRDNNNDYRLVDLARGYLGEYDLLPPWDLFEQPEIHGSYSPDLARLHANLATRYVENPWDGI